jgi:hypothetical protein
LHGLLAGAIAAGGPAGTGHVVLNAVILVAAFAGRLHTCRFKNVRIVPWIPDGCMLAIRTYIRRQADARSIAASFHADVHSSIDIGAP